MRTLCEGSRNNDSQQHHAQTLVEAPQYHRLCQRHENASAPEVPQSDTMAVSLEKAKHHFKRHTFSSLNPSNKNIFS